MNEWKTYRLGDIIEIVSGFAYKGEYLGKGDKYLLGMGCVSFNEQFLEKGLRPYSGFCDKRYYAKDGDIVLATRQQSDNMPILGMPAIIPKKYEGKQMIVGANLYRVINKSKDFSNDFIYWLLKSPDYVNYIKSCQTGTTVRMITKANIENYTFICPDRESRLLISHFLWTLENKIELNRRINANLEAQAQALFRSWFVDFEPFRDGPFVDSELGKIPQGWKVGTFQDIINITSGKRPPLKVDKCTSEAYIPVYGASSIQAYTTSFLRNEDLLLIGRVGTLGIVQKVTGLSWPSDNTLIITSPFYEYSYQILKTIDFNKLNRGSTQPLITQTDIKNQTILLPPNEVLYQYEKISANMFSLNKKNNSEIKTLSALRDTLLPKLMAGEIKINVK